MGFGHHFSAAWFLRDSVAVRDALNVPAARDLGGGLLATDERPARAVPDLVIAHAEVPRYAPTPASSATAPTRRQGCPRFSPRPHTHPLWVYTETLKYIWRC